LVGLDDAAAFEQGEHAHDGGVQELGDVGVGERGRLPGARSTTGASCEIRDTARESRHARGMSNAPHARDATAMATSGMADVQVSAELEAEIVAGIAEFDRGEYIELTREQLDHAATTGEWPWAEDESRG